MIIEFCTSANDYNKRRETGNNPYHKIFLPHTSDASMLRRKKSSEAEGVALTTKQHGHNIFLKQNGIKNEIKSIEVILMEF